MSLQIDTSAQLVWALANTEANLAGDDRLRPIHFFLGILKVIDPHFLKQLHGVDMSDDEHRLLTQESKQVRHYLEMSAEEVMRLRRSIRNGLREGKDKRTDIHMLHRSEESRTVFQRATEIVVQTGGTALSIIHLAEALFETGNICLENLKKPKDRPSSKGARWEIVKDKDQKGQQRFVEWFGRNLSLLAAERKLSPFVGRETELRLMTRILVRTNKRHMAVLGIPGVGKTALVEGLAVSLTTKKIPDGLKKVEILELHGSDIAADCGTESELSRRLMRLFTVLSRHKAAILFIDDFHGLFPSHLKPEAALDLLATILGQVSIPCIVTTTPQQWAALTGKAPSLSRRFHALQLDDPSRSDCRGIAEIWAKRIADLQKITFSPEALSAIVKAATDLPRERAMPDRIVDLLENAATFVKVSALSSQTGKAEVTTADVTTVLAEHYDIQPQRAP